MRIPFFIKQCVDMVENGAPVFLRVEKNEDRSCHRPAFYFDDGRQTPDFFRQPAPEMDGLRWKFDFKSRPAANFGVDGYDSRFHGRQM